MTAGHAPFDDISVVALCGGIGGAKLALGLALVVPPERLAVIVNTGDDFTHLGLHVSPDIDTVVYTLAGIANPDTGWGRKAETWHFMEAVAELGGEAWFRLGDTDLAMHAVRTARLQRGDRLTEITLDLARRLGVRPLILPATDDRLATIVDTDEGALPLQRYFVQRQCAPKVHGVRYEGAAKARPTPEVESALDAPGLSAIILCPSNPYLSIDPILAVPGLRERLQSAVAPVVAVSPIVGGKAVKGPLGKMMAELGQRVSPQAVADHYGEVIDVLVVDSQDAHLPIHGPEIRHADTVMGTLKDRIDLARLVLSIAADADKRVRA